MAVARSFSTLVALHNGDAMVIGGNVDARTMSVPIAEIYSAARNRWTTAPGSVSPRTGHQAAVLRDGRVLVTGGASYTSNGQPLQRANTEIYDPASRRWDRGATMHINSDLATITVLPNGKVLVAGGLMLPIAGTSSYPVASSEIYTPSSR